MIILILTYLLFISFGTCIHVSDDGFTKGVHQTMESVITGEDASSANVIRLSGDLETYPDHSDTTRSLRTKRSRNTPGYLSEIFNKAYNDPGKSSTNAIGN